MSNDKSTPPPAAPPAAPSAAPYVPNDAALARASAAADELAAQREAALAAVVDADGNLRPSHPMHPKNFAPIAPDEFAKIPEETKIDLLKEKLELLVQNSAEMIRHDLRRVLASGAQLPDLVVIVSDVDQPIVPEALRAQYRAHGKTRVIDVAFRKKFASDIENVAKMIRHEPYGLIAKALQAVPDEGHVWIAAFDGGGARTFQAANIDL